MLAIAAVVTLASCSGRLSTFDAAGIQAGRIEFVSHVLIWGLGAIWLGMVLLGLVVLLRPGWVGGAPMRRWLVWGGLVLPSAVMLPLFVWAVAETAILRQPGDGAVVIRADAFQWGWEFTYPRAPGRPSRDLLFLPQNLPVVLEIRARDVIHSLWIPQLAGKIDAVPGHVTTLPLTATRAGVFEGQCAEFCGLGHTEMRFVVDVRPATEFRAIVADLAAGRAPATAGERDPAAATGAAAAVRGVPPPPQGGRLQERTP